jgi:hypothetical protein
MAVLTSVLSGSQAQLAAAGAAAGASRTTSSGSKTGTSDAAGTPQSEGEKVARRFAEAFVKVREAWLPSLGSALPEQLLCLTTVASNLPLHLQDALQHDVEKAEPTIAHRLLMLP